MKTVWFAATATIAAFAATSGLAQSTIYKHVDESGRTTYSNKPMKGATVVDLEPLTTIAGSPVGSSTAPAPTLAPAKTTPARLVVTERPAAVEKPLPRTTLAAVEPSTLKPREDARRRELQEELTKIEQALQGARRSLAQEQQNPSLVAAVRAAQQATDPSPSQLAQFRENIERASGRIRGLQATVAEQEKALDDARRELEALKP